jgi:hypothetical protein
MWFLARGEQPSMEMQGGWHARIYCRPKTTNSSAIGWKKPPRPPKRVGQIEDSRPLSAVMGLSELERCERLSGLREPPTVSRNTRQPPRQSPSGGAVLQLDLGRDSSKGSASPTAVARFAQDRWTVGNVTFNGRADRRPVHHFHKYQPPGSGAIG